MWGGKGLWEAVPSPEGTSARGQVSCHGSWFPETNTGKEKKREVGRAWLLHPSWTLFTLGAMSGLLRELIPRAAWGLRSRARTSSLGPISQQDPLREGWSSFCQQGQGPASLCHLCAFCSHRGVTESWSKYPCWVSGPGAGESSWSHQFLAVKRQLLRFLLSTGGAAAHGQVGKGNKVWSPYKIFCCPNRSSLLQATP